MSLVETTGQIVEQCSPEQARSLTNSIKGLASATWDLIIEAYQTRAWAALGYGSWDAYTGTEFGATRLRLPAEERQEVVASLRDAGLSIRAIAAATGDSVGTVAAAAKSGVQNRTPEPPVSPIGDSPEVSPKGDSGTVTPNFKPPKVKGRDGKSYNAAAPSKEQLRAQAVEEYPWLDCPATDAEIIGAAQGLASYTGAELEARIENSKKWASMKVRQASEPPAVDRAALVAKLDDCLTTLVLFNVQAERASFVLKDHPDLIDLDDDEWTAAIASARCHLDDLTPLPRHLKVAR